MTAYLPLADLLAVKPDLSPAPTLTSWSRAFKAIWRPVAAAIDQALDSPELWPSALLGATTPEALASLPRAVRRQRLRDSAHAIVRSHFPQKPKPNDLRLTPAPTVGGAEPTTGDVDQAEAPESFGASAVVLCAGGCGRYLPAPSPSRPVVRYCGTARSTAPTRLPSTSTGSRLAASIGGARPSTGAPTTNWESTKHKAKRSRPRRPKCID